MKREPLFLTLYHYPLMEPKWHRYGIIILEDEQNGNGWAQYGTTITSADLLKDSVLSWEKIIDEMLINTDIILSVDGTNYSGMCIMRKTTVLLRAWPFYTEMHKAEHLKVYGLE